MFHVRKGLGVVVGVAHVVSVLAVAVSLRWRASGTEATGSREPS